MRTQYHPQCLDYISVRSSDNICKSQRHHRQELRQTAGLVLGLHVTVRLIATVLFCTLLLSGLMSPFHLTPKAWANEQVGKTDVLLFNNDSKDTQSGAAPVLTVASTNPDSGVAVTVSPNDVTGLGNGTTQFTRTYKVNIIVTLTAPSTAGDNNFQKWQRNGLDYATTPQTTITMDADYTLTAVYVTPTVSRTLTVASSNPNSGVAVTVSPNDVTGLGNGTTQFTRTYLNNTVVTLTAPSTAGGNNFQKWQRNGVDYATTAQTTVTMDANYTLTAVYVKPTVTRILTVASSNPDSGVLITVSPNDNSSQGNGTTQFTRTYLNNTVVTLTASSTAGGNNFQKWQRNGVDYATTSQTTVTMDANYTMTAVYVTPAVTQTLTVTSRKPDSGVPIMVSPNDITGLGSGATPFTRTYLNNTVVTLTAPPTAGDNNFVMWNLNGSPYSNEYQISILANARHALEALYEPLVKPKIRTLNVISSNPNGWDDGAVITITPNDRNGQGNGTTPLVRYYDDDTVVTLIPIWFVEGNNFLYWEINGVPYVNNIVATVTMGMDYTLIAHYAPPTVSMPFAVYGQESVTIGKGSSISGGAVGVGGSEGEELSGDRLKIMGARIHGDVYGNSVYLGRGSWVENVFANHLTNDRGRYRSLASFPDKLPRVLPLSGGNPGGEAIIVPAKGRAVLGDRQLEVHIGDGATAVLSGGRYEFESLELGKGSRLIAEAPSFLIVNRRLQIGDKCVVGPADIKVPLNLTIVVRGADKNRPAAIIGASSRIHAAIRVPSGTLEIGNKVNGKGSYYGSIVNIGEWVRIVSPQWDDTPDKDPQCLQRRCRSVGYQIICQTVTAEGLSCDDGNACTEGDVCTAEGYCQSGTPITDPNPNNNPCRRDTCDPIAGKYQPLGTVCDTNIQCQEPKMCDGQGHCTISGAYFAEGTLCDDGIPNNGVDTCRNGWCWGPFGQYDCFANNCSANPGEPPDLECWLNTHPGIRDQIIWYNSSPWVYWNDWTIAQKQELEQAFLDAWNWLAGGMTNFQGTPIPEPPPNNVPGASTQFSETIAWQLYLAKIAHSLAIEIGQWVPWSLCDYPTNIIYDLLSSRRHYWGFPNYTPTVNVTPAHPTFTYSFLSQNGLIGTTRHDTIAKLLDWGHKLNHYQGGWSAENAEAHWQYSGYAPVSRTIEGTIANIPDHPTFGHWTAGCWGTTDFLTDVLRSVNIPVQRLSVCSHITPYFSSEGLYLSHGDDPYDIFKEGTTTVFPQLGEILINQATFLNWFTGTPEYVCSNVARRPAELALQLLPDIIVTYYCWDVAANTPHDSGHVYNVFSSHFTLQELESTNLWDRLCLRAIELGACACE